MNEIWSQEEESSRLRARFEALRAEKGIGQAEFARANSVPGGASLLSQHIKNRRPINLEAATAYAKGFGCNLGEISPRLAKEVMKASITGHAAATLPFSAAVTGSTAGPPVPLETAVERIAQHLESLGDYDRGTAVSLMTTLARSPYMHASVASGLIEMAKRAREDPANKPPPAFSRAAA